MDDQLSKLRALASRTDPKIQRNMRVIAVSSGKGGVGKTNLVVNLALALAERNLRVIILDGDLGTANVDIFFGITPRYSIKHLLTGEKRIEEILYTVERGIKVLSGGSGVIELANLEKGQLKTVLVNMGRLERMADILLIDTGAGLGQAVLNFIGASDEVIIVITPEPSSMADAYGLLKSVKAQMEPKNINIIVNRIKNEKEARQTFERIEQTATRFLRISVNLMGWIYEDPSVTRSVMEQRPVGLVNPQSHAYRCVQWIAGNVIGNYLQPPSASKGIKGFITSLLNMR